MAYNNLYNPYQPSYTPQQNLMPVQQPSIPGAIVGVDGEASARAYQLPVGLAPGVPVALWDTNGKHIYLKSMNPMGMPNPIRKLSYTFDDEVLPVSAQQSGNAVEYATKADLERLKKEILEGMKTDAKPAV